MWISTHLALMTPTFGNFGADLRLLQSLGAALILSSGSRGLYTRTLRELIDSTTCNPRAKGSVPMLSLVLAKGRRLHVDRIDMG